MARPPRPWYWAPRDRWCVEIGGKRYTLAHGKAGKREAMAEFHTLMVSLGRQEAAPAERITFTELAELFLEGVAVMVGRGERTQSTYDGYVKYLSDAAERLGPHRVADLKPFHVTTWLDARGAAWGPTTRANAVTALKALTRWGRREGRLRADPFADLAKPTRQRREAVLSDDQVRAVLGATEGTPFADLVLGLWESGCRPGELTTLTADRVDIDRRKWMVLNKTRRKTGQEFRPVFLTPTLVELSRRLLEKHPEGLVFRNMRNAPWTRNAQALAWRRLRARLDMGPEATSYAIRHRYAREALRKGLPSSDVAALMGHRDAKMVDTVYGGWEQQEERLREAARRVRPGHDPQPDPQPEQ